MQRTTLFRTRVKICGITRPEDALEAARVGADAIGLVFYAASPRAVNVAQAQRILRVVPPFVTVVGLFVDAPEAWVREVLAEIPLDLLQFHGHETPAQCAGYGRPYLKAVAVREQAQVAAAAERYADASGLLLDTYDPLAVGGTGKTFDWSCIPSELTPPVVLAGGLNAANVEHAVTAIRPYGVDVSSGVEAAKGIKDPEKLAAFMRGVRSADAG